MLAGAIRGWWLYAAPGRVRDLVSLGLWLFFVENVALPEPAPGVRRPVAAGLPRRAARRPSRSCWTSPPPRGSRRRCSCCPVPSWVHPAWLICAGLLVPGRRPQGRRAALDGDDHRRRLPRLPRRHVAAAWSAMGFPPSVLPFVLLVGAVLVDLAVTCRVPGWLAGPVVAGVVYGVAVGQEALGLLPPWNWWSVLPVAVGLRPAVGRRRPARPQPLAGPLEARRRARRDAGGRTRLICGAPARRVGTPRLDDVASRAAAGARFARPRGARASRRQAAGADEPDEPDRPEDIRRAGPDPGAAADGGGACALRRAHPLGHRRRRSGRPSSPPSR